LIVVWVMVAVLAVNWGIPNEEHDLTSRANDLLEGTGLSVHFDGRDATITGVADEATIAAARNTIANTRGVRRVDVSATESAPVTTAPAPPTTTSAASQAPGARFTLAIYRDSAQSAGLDIPLEVDPEAAADALTRMVAGGADFPTRSAVSSDVPEPASTG
jgi:hypothetical protein